jgi:hypothetical protein
MPVATPLASGSTLRVLSRISLSLVSLALLGASVNCSGSNDEESILGSAELQTCPCSIWPSTATPKAAADPDTAAVELGVKFRSDVAGMITGVRFYKSTTNTGVHTGSLWSSNGQRLATATFRGETASGWQTVRFATPVAIAANRTYVASYHTNVGRYAGDNDAFANAGVDNPPLHALRNGVSGGNGVYKYGASGFPTDTYRASNYWVDVILENTTSGGTDGGTVDAAPPPDSAPPPPPPPDGGTGGPLSLPLVPWEGGPSYYGRFPQANAGGWTNPSFFPVGVWFESVLDQGNIDLDKAAGLNTYVELTSNSNLAIVRNNGLFAIAGGGQNVGNETVGHILSDEADMWAGPGNAAWTGNYPGEGAICNPSTASCGYTVMQTLLGRVPNDGRMRYTNYGKGVMLWETATQGAQFVNGYTQVVSNDIYWYTDPNICGEAPNFLGIPSSQCRLAANYGVTMDKMRDLDGRDGSRQPIYAFVEDGHPFTESFAPTINGNQLAGAVFNSLIHEARGIIYFNHNFGGSCISQHVLRDNCGAAIRPKVIETNQRIKELARVLNTQSYVHAFNPALDTMLKYENGSYYVFAMLKRGSTPGTTYTFTLPSGLAGASATVLWENRSVPITAGTFRDTFAAEYTYHVYKITP